MLKSLSIRILLGSTASITALLPQSANACWDAAANRYGINSELLYAIARTESGLDAKAIGTNRNGSRDLGLMQINSWWLPTLAKFGIHEADLFDACTSIHVGAWILAQNVSRYGYTWEAVGAYNATSPQLRAAYVARVRRHLPASAGHDRANPIARPAAHPRTTALHP